MFVQCIVYCVQCTPFPPVAEICVRLAGNFSQYITTVLCWANSLVWVAVCYFTASQQGGGGRGSEATLSPQRYTAFHYLAQVARAGRGVVFPPLGQISKVSLGSCVQLYSLAETPQLPPPPRIWAHIRGRYWSAKIETSLCYPLVSRDYCGKNHVLMFEA